MIKNLSPSATLDLLFDNDISEVIFYDTCSFSRHSCLYNEDFPISQWFNLSQLIIVTDIIDFELKEKDQEGQLRDKYIRYTQVLQSRVKGLLLLNSKMIIDMYYEVIEEIEARRQILYFLKGISQTNSKFRYLLGQINLDDREFSIKVKKVLDEIFYSKDYNNMGEYSILYACLGLRLLDFSQKLYILTDNTADVDLISAPFTDSHSIEGTKKQLQLLRYHFSPLLNNSNIIRFYSTVRMLSELIQNDWNERNIRDLIDICAFYDIEKRNTHYSMVQDGVIGDHRLIDRIKPDYFVEQNINKNMVVYY